MHGAKHLGDASGSNVLNVRTLRTYAGGDERAQVDFYSPYCYDWMSAINPHNPFYFRPADCGLPGNRPLVCGECLAKGTTHHQAEEDFQNVYQNDRQGGMGWTSNGVDGNGDLTALGTASRAFRDHHPLLVFHGVPVSINIPVPIPATFTKNAARP